MSIILSFVFEAGNNESKLRVLEKIICYNKSIKGNAMKVRNLIMTVWMISLLMVSSIATADFVDNGGGTVTDTVTQLVWQKCSLGRNNNSTCSIEL